MRVSLIVVRSLRGAYFPVSVLLLVLLLILIFFRGKGGDLLVPPSPYHPASHYFIIGSFVEIQQCKMSFYDCLRLTELHFLWQTAFLREDLHLCSFPFVSSLFFTSNYRVELSKWSHCVRNISACKLEAARHPLSFDIDVMRHRDYIHKNCILNARLISYTF